MIAPPGESVPAPWPRRRAMLAAGAVAVLYLAGVTNCWWPTPDSALYQQLGRNLVEGRGYRFNGQVNTEVTPGLPVVLGALRWAFGDGFWAPNLLMAVCGLGALGMAYLTLARRTDRRTAWLVVLGVSLCYRSYDYSHLILTDAPFALLFWLLAYATVRAMAGTRWWLAAIVPLAVASAVIRAPGLIVLGPWAASVVLDRASPARVSKRLVVAAAVLAPAVAIVGGFYWLARSVADAAPAYATGAGNGAGLPGRLYQVALGWVRLGGAMVDSFTAQRSPWLAPVGVALVALAVIGGVVLWRRGRRLLAATCLLNLVGVCFLVGAASVRARYLMPLYPMILLLVLTGLLSGARWWMRRRGRPVSPKTLAKAAGAFVALLVIANAFLVLRHAVVYSVMGHLGRYHEFIEGGRYRDLYAAGEFLRDRVGPEERIAARWDRVRMLHFLTGRRIEPLLAQYDRWKPCHAQRVYDDFRRSGCDVVLFDTGGLYKPYARYVAERFDAADDLDVLYRGTTITIYRRRGPATQASAGRSASGGGG